MTTDKIPPHERLYEVTTPFKFIDRTPLPEIEKLENMPISSCQIVMIDTARFDRLKACEAALAEILAIKAVTGGLDYEAGYEEGVTHCQSIAQKALDESEAQS